MEIIKKQDYEKKSINQERFNSSAYRLFLFAGSILSILFIFAFVIDREVYNALIQLLMQWDAILTGHRPFIPHFAI